MKTLTNGNGNSPTTSRIHKFENHEVEVVSTETKEETKRDPKLGQEKIKKNIERSKQIKEIEKEERSQDLAMAESELQRLQDQTLTKEQLLNMGIADVFEALGLKSDYNSRYELADSLHQNGIALFTGEMNPYSDESNLDTHYIGTTGQNAKFVRNLAENATLFQDGKLVVDYLEKWKAVD